MTSKTASPLDLLLINGRVVVPESGETDVAIGIEGEQIAVLAAPDRLPPARQVIDLKKKVVLPGVIDPHTHVKFGPADGWFTETRAAATAGITTILDHQILPTSYVAAYPSIREEADLRSCVDYGLHFSPSSAPHMEDIDACVKEFGVKSFKLFMNFRGNGGAYLGVPPVDDGYLYELCQRIARHPGALLCIHAENSEIVNRLEARLVEEGREGLQAWAASRPPIAEAENVNRAAFFGRQTGCAIYVVHLSSEAGLREVQQARQDGTAIYAETCPHYLSHTMDCDLGLLAKTNPPLRTQEDVEALWRGLFDGSIDTVGSDHVPRRRAAKSGTTWSASRGCPALSMILPVLISEGVHRRGLSLRRVSQLTSYNPARVFGLYPRKGSIRVGGDADLTIVDLDVEREVRWQSLLSDADYSIYEGRRLKGWPVLTILRGSVVARDGALLGGPGMGRYVSR